MNIFEPSITSARMPSMHYGTVWVSNFSWFQLTILPEIILRNREVILRERKRGFENVGPGAASAGINSFQV